MSNRTCEEFQQSMDLLLTPEGAGDQQARLLEHLKQCPDCAQTYSLMERLRRSDPHSDPSDAEFQAMRRGVLRDIRHSKPQMPDFLDRLGGVFRKPAFALSCSALLAAAGFFAGRQMEARQRVPKASWTASEDAMVTQIKLAAVKNRGLQDLEKAEFTYENVKVEDQGGGQVALSFDVSRHVALSLPKNDPIVTDVLIQTLVSPSHVGTKLQAISCTGNILEPKVKDGLIKVMLADPNLGVRLKAQSKLIEQNGDPEVKDALLQVLQHEESVQMKLVAIDHLTRQRIDPNLIRRAIAPARGRDAVYLKAMNYINENGGMR